MVRVTTYCNLRDKYRKPIFLPADGVEQQSYTSDMTRSSLVDSGEILSVSDVNREARRLLEDGLGQVAIVGELSNLARPQSGHLYFSLKDPDAQLRCAFFRQRQRGLGFHPANGDEVIVFGRISLYEPRGDYQLIVEHMEQAGAGALQREFDRLRKQLGTEGLFDAERKRSLPVLPSRIGVITSPSGAAVRDILNILARRFPAVPVRIYPVAVQGDKAPADIVAALMLANQRRDCDVLILARGGGSIEDLWAFNDEHVVRQVAASQIPTISGVGHETDTTLADFAADVRAPTPSGAAELSVPEQHAWRQDVSDYGRSLKDFWLRTLTQYQQQLDWLSRALANMSPRAQLRLREARLSAAQLRLRSALQLRLRQRSDQQRGLSARLLQHSPTRAVATRFELCRDLDGRLRSAITKQLAKANNRLALSARGLDTLSPLATLARGYAIVSTSEGKKVVRHADDVAVGESLRIRLELGTLSAIVTADQD